MLVVAIAGLGVIGGSLAKALVEKGQTVRAFSPSKGERDRARAAGIDVVDALGAPLVRDASAVVIAVPLDRIASVARALRPDLPSGCVVMHAGSLQRSAALGVDDSDREWLLGTHPLAGSEGSGFDGARADLFAGAAVSADMSATAEQRTMIESVWRAVGVERFVWRSPEEHDRVMSWVSHLPQLASTALALALSREGITAADGGPGLRDTTRLAASSLLIWRPLLDAAPDDTARALRELERAVSELRDALETGEQELLSEMWATARAWRDAKESSSAG